MLTLAKFACGILLISENNYSIN